VEKLKGQTCNADFLGAKGIHIDPYGNVFSGTCSGIIIGNVNHKPLEEIWRQFHPAQSELVNILFEQGPAGLLEKALPLVFARKQGGYKKAKVYANKCHLCTSIRQFLVDKGLGQSTIGPQELYNSKL
jgi:hypothetical protein